MNEMRIARHVTGHDKQGRLVVRLAIYDLVQFREIVIETCAISSLKIERVETIDYTKCGRAKAMEDALHFANEFISEFLNES